MRAVAAASCVVALALAGCASASESGSRVEVQYEPVSQTKAVDTGGVQGQVWDDERRPVVGANVVSVEARANAATDSDGFYVLAGLAPGVHTIQVDAAGYSTSLQKVEITVGDVATLDFFVEQAASTEPFVDVQIHDGFLNCSVGITNPPSTPCEHVAADRAKFFFELRADAEFQNVVLEAIWTPSVPMTADRMRLSVCQTERGQPFPGSEYFLCYPSGYANWTTGPSPLVLNDHKLPADKIKTYETNLGSEDIAIQQRFELYQSVCYYAPCLADYTARGPQ